MKLSIKPKQPHLLYLNTVCNCLTRAQQCPDNKHWDVNGTYREKHCLYGSPHRIKRTFDWLTPGIHKRRHIL